MPQSPKRVRGKPLTNDIILERFKAVHGEIYDYSKVIFKTNNDPVIIICTRHGEYLCSPKRHSLGSRCRKCYLEDVNGKFMQKPEYRQWASENMKKPSTQLKLKSGMNKKYGVDNASQVEQVRIKKKKIFLSRYGVDHPFKIDIEARIKKTKDTRILIGTQISDENHKPFLLYKREVWKHTYFSIGYYDAYWLLENRSRSGNHIDHIYSIHEGFINTIPTKIIGSIINLQSLPSKENRSKGTVCWITKDELCEQYNNL